MRNEQSTHSDAFHAYGSTLLFQVVTEEPVTTINYGKQWGFYFEQVLQASMGGVMLLVSETITAFRQSCGLR